MGKLPKWNQRRPLTPEMREAWRHLDRFSRQVTLVAHSDMIAEQKHLEAELNKATARNGVITNLFSKTYEDNVSGMRYFILFQIFKTKLWIKGSHYNGSSAQIKYCRRSCRMNTTAVKPRSQIHCYSVFG